MRTLCILGMALGLGLACKTNPPVRYPDGLDGPSTPAVEKACEQRPADENNCSACTSQPACDWCESPEPGYANCQATTQAETGCQTPIQRSTDDCEGPKAPPGGVD